MARTFTVEMLLHGWQDVTANVAPDWTSAQICGEPSFGAFAASNLQFTFGKDALSLINQLRAADTDVHVRLSEDSTVLFYGVVEPGEFSYTGAYISGFTAVSLLGYAARVDKSYVDGDAWYSGPAKTYYESALRDIGCLAGTVDDVYLKDYCLTADPDYPIQSDANWTRAKVYRGISRVDTETEYGLGDFVLAQVSDTYTTGFTVWGGTLYRVGRFGSGQRIYFSACLDASGNPFTTKGYRLFRFLGPDSIECLAIVEAQLQPGYSMTKRTSPLWAIGGMAAGIGLIAIPGLQGVGLAAAEAGLTVAVGVGSSATAAKRYERQSNTHWVVTGARVISVGDGYNGNGSTGMGDAFDESIGSAQGLVAENTVYIPADSCCTDQSNAAGTSPGRFWFCRYNSDNNQFEPIPCWWTGSEWHTSTTRTVSGGLAGGMAARDGCLCIGRENGFDIIKRWWDLGNTWKYYHLSSAHCPSRFIGSLDLGDPDLPPGATAWGHVLFVVGNGSLAAHETYWIVGSNWAKGHDELRTLTGADAVRCCQAEGIDTFT